MRKFSMMLALATGLSAAAATPTQAGMGSWGQDLSFVAETTIPGNGTISLCHLTDYMRVLFIPVYTTIEGYALSGDGCTGTMYRDLTTEHFEQLQLAGMIPADLPSTPSVTLKEMAWNHAWLIIVPVALLFKLLVAVLSNRGSRPRKAAAPDALAIHSLVAMSQVAVADGKIDEAEIRQISFILTRLTGRGYGPDQVSELLTQLNPSPNDLAQVGQDLSEADRQIVLEAALNIAVADGEIHPSEYAVVSDLAQRMRIGADQFRGAMNRIAAHLQSAQPV